MSGRAVPAAWRKWQHDYGINCYLYEPGTNSDKAQLRVLQYLRFAGKAGQRG